MRRMMFTALALGGCAATTALATDVTAPANETGTILATGPREAPNGDRFFNIQGLDSTTNAAYGVARFNLAEIRDNLDLAFGAGNWFVAGVDLRMAQSNAGFTTNGGVRLFYTADDTTDIKSATSPLSYPFEDTPGTPDLAVNLGDPVTTYNFVEVATGHVDSYVLYRLGNSGSRDAVATDVETNDVLTLVYVEGDSAVAATYGGQTPDSNSAAPTLRIRAIQNGANVPPFAIAGPDQFDEDLDSNGIETITFDASGSVDVDGTITNYTWREGTTVVASGTNPILNASLTVGIHTIELTTTDNLGGTDTDTMVVTIVAGPVPTAEAGFNQEVTDADQNGSEAVTLDGSASSDVDGTIVNYEWREGATVLGSGPNPTLNVNLSVGSHTIRLIVTDDDTQTDIDFVQVDVRPGNIIAGHDFDGLQDYLTYTPVPDTNATPFTSPGDGFGIFGRVSSTSIPFSLVDDSAGVFITDNLGIVKSEKLDNWFGVNDLTNNDNLSGLGTVTWTFDIAGESNIGVSVDMAAMGDFEPADTFVWRYAIDGGTFADLFVGSVNDAGSKVYELERGTTFTLADPLSFNAIELSNNFQTLSASIAGTGSVLTVQLSIVQDSDEPYVFDNLFVTAGNVDPCPCAGDFDNSNDVGLADLSALLSSFGGVPSNPCMDTDADGLVGLADLSAFLSRFGSSCN